MAAAVWLLGGAPPRLKRLCLVLLFLAIHRASAMSFHVTCARMQAPYHTGASRRQLQPTSPLMLVPRSLPAVRHRLQAAPRAEAASAAGTAEAAAEVAAAAAAPSWSTHWWLWRGHRVRYV